MPLDGFQTPNVHTATNALLDHVAFACRFGLFRFFSRCYQPNYCGQACVGNVCGTAAPFFPLLLHKFLMRPLFLGYSPSFTSSPEKALFMRLRRTSRASRKGEWRKCASRICPA